MARRSPSIEDQLVPVRQGLTRLGRLLSSRRVHVGMAGAAGVELSEQAMNVLRALGDREEMPMGDLARAAHMDTGAVSRQVRVLEAEGLLHRRTSPQHRSIVLVEATPEGRDVARRFERVRNAQLTRALGEWTDEERAQLGSLLIRLVDDLMRTPYLRSDGED
ncbi:MAG: MarR family transcriptional regulator [Actinobacteria bacterium]|nr:MarR family transcriptional regulator [Actinomycetota bacterium]